MEKRFVVTITEEGQERGLMGRKWVEGAGEDGNWGYAPEVETVAGYTRQIFTQELNELDLKTVVAAINGL